MTHGHTFRANGCFEGSPPDSRPSCKPQLAVEENIYDALEYTGALRYQVVFDAYQPASTEKRKAPQPEPMGATDAVMTTATPAKRSKSESLTAPTDMTKAEPFPKEIPMENKYTGEKYFVRECYAQYYAVVLDLLRKRKGVSVTGTPGIGTSLCMAYFFQRFSREHPSVTVKMASYGRNSVFKQAVKVRGGKVIESDDADANKTAIWLLDGTPTTIPGGHVHWVSFTTPDESWMKQLAKNTGSCAEVFMPVWTLRELREAALVLGRSDLLEQISDDELRVFGVDPSSVDASVPRPTVLDYRFAVFGGVPRWCFAEDSDWLVDPIEWLRNELRQLSLDDVRDGWTADVQKSPSVLQFVPDKRTHKLATARVASTAIELYFAAREQSIVESKPTEFEQSVLRGIPDMEAILALSMTVRLYRRLQFHCTAEATKLGGEGGKYLLLDSLHGSNMHWLTSSFEMTPFREGEPQWTTPFGTSLLSNNRFCCMPGPGRVVIFQVTPSMQYSVNASGYSKVLKTLGLWEAVQQSPHTVAALVFVVPKWNMDTFRAQSISCHPLLDDASPVMEIGGLAEVTVNELAELGIYTVGNLRTFTVSNERLSKAEWERLSEAQATLKQIESGEGGVAFQDEAHVIERLPQYVWGL